ncbi:MAG: GNAT family N-acetyltransferase [Bradyrhizobium sp.]
MEIVPIAAEYVESFHRALDCVVRERRFLAFLEAPPIESTRAFVLNNIEQGYPQFVAISAGEVMGWCDVLPKPRPVHAHVGVLGVALLPGFRGQGHGERLMRQTLDAARAFGMHRVELTVRQHNTNAIALYRKIGFEIEGLMRDAIKVDDVCENVVLMGLLFE